jgi:outer membrane protein assembly factor BamE (lipoprotein component of BamABCDE complex)
MNKLGMICLGAVLIGALSGCAGGNFVRPDAAALQNGKTTISEARATYGSPFREAEVTVNDKTIKELSYAYSSLGSPPLEAGVIPARALTLGFWKDRMVSNVFTSSFKDDASIFDESKRAAIVKGKTTREEVVKLLGKPSGYAIYPFTKEKDQQALIYLYQATRGSAFNLKVSKRQLTVIVDQNGIVADTSYFSSGMQ